MWDGYVELTMTPEDYKVVPILREHLYRLAKQDEYLFDCLCQPQHFSVGVIVAASRLYYAWIEGHVEFTVIEINEEPPSDAGLTRWRPRLPQPFEMELWGGLADYDGVLGWHQSIPFVNPKTKQIRWHNPSAAPVEVGTCHPEKIMFALTECGYIARIPYGHTKVLLLSRSEGF